MSEWNSRSVLVTGAGGFIGSHLTERLVDLGARVRALVHYNSANSRGWLDHSPAEKEIEVIEPKSGGGGDHDIIVKCMRCGTEAYCNIVYHVD